MFNDTHKAKSNFCNFSYYIIRHSLINQNLTDAVIRLITPIKQYTKFSMKNGHFDPRWHHPSEPRLPGFDFRCTTEILWEGGKLILFMQKLQGI